MLIFSVNVPLGLYSFRFYILSFSFFFLLLSICNYKLEALKRPLKKNQAKGKNNRRSCESSLEGNWLKLVQTGLNWFQLVQTSSNWLILLKTSSFKLVQSGF